MTGFYVIDIAAIVVLQCIFLVTEAIWYFERNDREWK